MVHNISGDALVVSKGGILCHQTNFFGVMGAGIAAAIKAKLLSHENYIDYVHVCKKLGRKTLGMVQFLNTPDGTVVANCFSQDDKCMAYPGNRISPVTDYNAMRKCFHTVCTYAFTTGKNAYVPYKIGCGIAGGDWQTVEAILNDEFSHSRVNLYIVRMDNK